MKYTITILIGLFIFSLSHAQTRSFKRGLGFNTLLKEDVGTLSEGVSWGYNWGHTITGETQTAFGTYNMEFVPMAWNGIDKERMRSFLRNHPEVKYILGFNEPNFGDQANMGPVAAAAKWPDIEEIADEFGLTIVGPAVNFAGSNAVVENGIAYTDPVRYLDDFFKACPACRVDHIAVHFYMGSAGAIKSNVESFKKYNKPIWLTEFCANGTGQTVKSQTKFMVETLDYLETEPMIYRYAWFKERGNFSTLPNMQILNSRNEGVLTDLGEVFVHMSSYDDDFFFTTNEQIQSEHYIRMSGINLEKTTDESGHINLCEFGRTDSVDYNVDVPTAGEYNVFFRVASEYTDESIIYVSVNDQELTSMSLDNKTTGEWNTQQCKVTLNQGKQKIRLGFKKGGLKLNWWALSKNDTPPSGINVVEQASSTIYPNPVEDILTIQSEYPVNVVLSNLQGQSLYSAKEVQTIDMSSYPQGMYLLSIQFPNGKSKTEKIIKK